MKQGSEDKKHYKSKISKICPDYLNINSISGCPGFPTHVYGQVTLS